MGSTAIAARGKPLRSNCLTELVHRCVAQAGLATSGSCHLFRHTMPTFMLENGAEVRYLSSVASHK